MHARAAVKFVQIANSFKSEVKVVKDGQEANGKSIMGLLTLVAAHGVTMTVVCDGDDADAAVAALAELVGDGLRRGGRSRDGEAGRAWALRPGIAIGVAHVLASRVEIHERRIAAEQVDAELRALREARCRRPTRSWRASRPRSRSARATTSSTGSSRPTG